MSTRLLSPTKRRIYPNARSGAGRSPAANEDKHVDYLLRSGLKVGQPDDLTWGTLKSAGWAEYDGPAATDSAGYVIPGTDPAVVPDPWEDPKNQGRAKN